MIAGVVSNDLEATVRLNVLGSAGQHFDVEFVVDTGFNGWISLPAALISQLSLPWRRQSLGELADGSETLFDTHEGAIEWGGEIRRVWVDEIVAAPLLGMSPIKKHLLRIETWAGGSVTITRRAGVW